MKEILAGMVIFGASMMPATASANDFPTTSRVEYVLECMNANQGKYEYLYKCSCAIDRIASKVDYDEYVEISTAARHRSLGGERGAEFRDPESVRVMAKKYNDIQAESNNACFIK
jgi:hypothetical protein